MLFSLFFIINFFIYDWFLLLQYFFVRPRFFFKLMDRISYRFSFLLYNCSSYDNFWFIIIIYFYWWLFVFFIFCVSLIVFVSDFSFLFFCYFFFYLLEERSSLYSDFSMFIRTFTFVHTDESGCVSLFYWIHVLFDLQILFLSLFWNKYLFDDFFLLMMLYDYDDWRNVFTWIFLCLFCYYLLFILLFVTKR